VGGEPQPRRRLADLSITRQWLSHASEHLVDLDERTDAIISFNEDLLVRGSAVVSIP